MVVSVAVQGLDGFGSVFPSGVVDEGEALALAAGFVPGEEDPGGGAEGLEEVLEVGLDSVLGQVGDVNSRGVVCPRLVVEIILMRLHQTST